MNTGIHVTLDYIGSNDHAFEKLTVALQGGLQPDITYQYGTSMAALATAPGIMDLTDRVQDPAFNWDDFSEGARAAATVDGQVYGIPALIDNLAIVYNKDLFEAAGVDEPTADWTWDDFRAAAKALTDPVEAAVRVRVPDRRHRGHRLALRRDALGSRRRHPERRQHRGRVQLPGGRAGAHDAAGDGGHRQVGVPRPAERRQDRRPVQRRQDRRWT